MLAAARAVRLEARPGTRSKYSDIGFIVLGELLEKIAGEPMDSFCAREMFDPLKLNIRYLPQLEQLMDIPPTASDFEYRNRVVQGEVNDENASAMGGVAGHAGLFGDAGSVARFAACLLRGGAPLFRAGRSSFLRRGRAGRREARGRWGGTRLRRHRNQGRGFRQAVVRAPGLYGNLALVRRGARPCE